MVPSIWLIAAFLAGTAVGALLVALQRISTLSRVREQFRAELEALTESSASSSSEEVSPQTDRPHRAA